MAGNGNHEEEKLKTESSNSSDGGNGSNVNQNENFQQQQQQDEHVFAVPAPISSYSSSSSSTSSSLANVLGPLSPLIITCPSSSTSITTSSPSSVSPSSTATLQMSPYMQHHTFSAPLSAPATISSSTFPKSPGVIVRATVDSGRYQPQRTPSIGEDQSGEQTRALDLRTSANHRRPRNSRRAFVAAAPPLPAPKIPQQFEQLFCRWCKEQFFHKTTHPGFCCDNCFSSYRRIYYKKRICARCGLKGDWDVSPESLDADALSPSLLELPDRYCQACRATLPSSSGNTPPIMEHPQQTATNSEGHIPFRPHLSVIPQQQYPYQNNNALGESLPPYPRPSATPQLTVSAESTRPNHLHRQIQNMNPLPSVPRSSSRYRHGGFTGTMSDRTYQNFNNAASSSSSTFRPPSTTFHPLPSTLPQSTNSTDNNNSNQGRYGSSATSSSFSSTSLPFSSASSAYSSASATFPSFSSSFPSASSSFSSPSLPFSSASLPFSSPSLPFSSASSSSMPSQTERQLNNNDFYSCPIANVIGDNNNSTSATSTATGQSFEMMSPTEQANQQSPQQPSTSNMTLTFMDSSPGEASVPVQQNNNSTDPPSGSPQADEAVVAAANTLMTMIAPKTGQKGEDIKNQKMGNTEDAVVNDERPSSPPPPASAPVHYPTPPPRSSPLPHASAFAMVVKNPSSQKATTKPIGTAMLNSPPVALVPQLSQPPQPSSQATGTTEGLNQGRPMISQRQQEGRGLGLRDYLCQPIAQMPRSSNIQRPPQFQPMQSTPRFQQNFQYLQQPQTQQQQQQRQNNLFNTMYPLSIDIPRNQGNVHKRPRMDYPSGSNTYLSGLRRTYSNQEQSPLPAQHHFQNSPHRNQTSAFRQQQQRRFQPHQPPQYNSTFQQQQQHYPFMHTSHQQQQQYPAGYPSHFGVTIGQWPSWTNMPHDLTNLGNPGRGSVTQIGGNGANEMGHQQGSIMSMVNNDNAFNYNLNELSPPSAGGDHLVPSGRSGARRGRDTPAPYYRPGKEYNSRNVVTLPSQPPPHQLQQHPRITPTATITSDQQNQDRRTVEPLLSIVSPVTRERENGETRPSTVRTSIAGGGLVGTVVTDSAPPSLPLASPIGGSQILSLSQGAGTSGIIITDEQQGTPGTQRERIPSRRGRGRGRGRGTTGLIRRRNRRSSKQETDTGEDIESNEKAKIKKFPKRGAGRPRGGGRGGSAAALRIPRVDTEPNETSTSTGVQGQSGSSSFKQNDGTWRGDNGGGAGRGGDGQEGGGKSSNAPAGGSGQVKSLAIDPPTTMTFLNGSLTNGGNIIPRMMPPPPPLFVSPHYRRASATLPNISRTRHMFSPPSRNTLSNERSSDRRYNSFRGLQNSASRDPLAVPVFLPVPIVVPVAECAYNALVKDAINRDHADPKQDQQGADTYRDYEKEIDHALRMSLIFANRNTANVQSPDTQQNIHEVSDCFNHSQSEQPQELKKGRKRSPTFELIPPPVNNAPELATVLQPPLIVPPPISFPPPIHNISPPNPLAGYSQEAPGSVLICPNNFTSVRNLGAYETVIKTETGSPFVEYEELGALDVGNEVEIYADEDEVQESDDQCMSVAEEQGVEIEGFLVVAEDAQVEDEERDNNNGTDNNDCTEQNSDSTER